MKVSLTIHSSQRAYKAIHHEVANRDQCSQLINGILADKHLETILFLMHDCHNSLLELSLKQIHRGAMVVWHKGSVAQKMEYFSLMPTNTPLLGVRIKLINAIVAQAPDRWLKGKDIGGNVHHLFQTSEFLPAEVQRMLRKVRSSKSSATVCAMILFKAGLLSDEDIDSLERLEQQFKKREERLQQRRLEAA